MEFRARIDTAIEALQKNLDAHIAELADASAGWTAKMVAALEAARDAVSRKGLEAAYSDLTHLMYARPQDDRKQYSRLLGALKVTRDAGETHITMSEQEYDQIFNDNWDWRQSSRASNSVYNSSR